MVRCQGGRAPWLQLSHAEESQDSQRENRVNNAMEADEMQFGQSSRGREESRGKKS